MNIEINAKDLFDILNDTSNISKGSLSEYQQVYLYAKDDKLEIFCYNDIMKYQKQIDCKVMKQGAISLNHTSLRNVVKTYNKQDIILQLSGNNLEITSNNSKSQHQIGIYRQGNELDIYSIETTKEPVYEFEIDSNIFINAINSVKYAASKEESRYFLNSVHIGYEEDKLLFMGCDGKRIAINHIPINNEKLKDISLTIPIFSINQLNRIHTEDTLKLKIYKDKIMVEYDTTTLQTSLIETDYVNYKQVMPNDLDKELLINRSNMIDLINSTCSLSEKEKRILLSINKKGLEIKFHEETVGKSSNMIEMDTEYDKILLAMNYEYLLQTLNVLDTDDIIFKFKDDRTAYMLYNKDNLETFHLIAPMRIMENEK